MRRGLLLFDRNAQIVPEVNLGLLHVDQVAQFGEVVVKVGTGEGRWIATMEVQYELVAVRGRVRVQS